jgi:AcrR family transcriptional regulator
VLNRSGQTVHPQHLLWFNRKVARNTERRNQLSDAGLRVLARAGARGLTHRAVDAEAGTPVGTASNYFRTRAELLDALARRLFDRIGPTAERLAELGHEDPTVELAVRYIGDIVDRLTGAPELTLALLELRLEASRNPEIAEVVRATLTEGFEADVAFNEQRGLPGGRFEIALLHYAIDGFVLDQLSTPITSDLQRAEVVDALVRRLLRG